MMNFQYFQKLKLLSTDFYEWWSDQLYSLVPEKVKILFSGSKVENWLEFSANGLTALQLNEGEKSVEEFDGDALQLLDDETFKDHLKQNFSGLINVSLSNEFILERGFEVPQVAKNNYKNVVKFELPQLFPVSAGALHFDCYPLQEDQTEDYQTIQVGIVKKKISDNIITVLEECGLGLKNLSANSEKTDNSTFRFLNLEAKYRKKAETLLGILLGSAVLLSILCVWAAANFFDDRAEFLNTRLVALAQQVAEVSEVRKQISDHERKESLVIEKTSNSNLDQILEVLTNSFPDNSWVYEYSQSGNQIRLRGNSADTSSLIQTLNESKLFSNISNSAELINDRESRNLERFTVTMTLNEQSQVREISDE